ncbi:MAG: hypothetical protein ACI9TY_001202 [Alphaproteobacteria bacterium]
MDDDEVIKAPESDGMGTIILMLGLYLIVLAFFILLNAMSETSEEKVKQASESVAEGFGFQLTGPVNMRDDVEITVNPVFDIISREIQSVLESYISDNNFKFSTNADQMLLSIDTKRIFAPGSIRIRPAMAYFFEDVARIVATKRPGSRLVAEVVVKNDKTDLGNSQVPLRELAGRRAALFIRALAERGIDTKYISASAELTGESTVDVFFKIIITDYQKSTAAPRDIVRRDGKDSGKIARPEPYKK